ncbi:unnamed protein product [Cylindrotheca closterium]|uniref:Arb2 domain-containing protein n=1 Tax=Cylindrotheca closterium TaxID=2856 RepID=A0AAD2G9K6_9STRA|nr:unnamed protein product [Cylindrotheca closterium]
MEAAPEHGEVIPESTDLSTLEEHEKKRQESSTSISSNSSSPKKRRPSLKKVRRGSHHIANPFSVIKHKAGSAIGHVFHIFSHQRHHDDDNDGHHDDGHQHIITETVQSQPTRVRGGVRLRGCSTDDEHRSKTRELVLILRSSKGEDALLATGFEYRTISPSADAKSEAPDLHLETEDEIEEERDPAESAINDHEASKNSEFDGPERCLPSARLFHIESDTMITSENRKEFIADGDMYDALAHACQECAQDVMMNVGDLEWVDVCEAGNNAEPIRAIVSKAINADKEAIDKTPTLLIATGNGKVRAGIFSRQHLICNGMECSTALPIVREACRRKMNVIMLDPNVHGDRLGMITFEKSMAKVFKSWEDETCSADRPPLGSRDLYVLSHSQSGAQFAGYLLDKSKHYLPHIRAIAFTDSTHNIRWAREDNNLLQLLESEKSVYFKVSKEGTSENPSLGPLETLGTEIATDAQWQDRFGQIKTKCAGTTEHSLTNWFARNQIWDHFDNFLKTSFGDSSEDNNVQANKTRDDKP